MQQLSRLVLTLTPVPHSHVDNTVYVSHFACIFPCKYKTTFLITYMHACLIIICCAESVDTMAQSTASLLYNHTEVIPEHAAWWQRAEDCYAADSREECQHPSTPWQRVQQYMVTWAFSKWEYMHPVQNPTWSTSAWIKRCPNTKCLARHSYHSWKGGLEHTGKYMTLLQRLYLQLLLTRCLQCF